MKKRFLSIMAIALLMCSCDKKTPEIPADLDIADIISKVQSFTCADKTGEEQNIKVEFEKNENGISVSNVKIGFLMQPSGLAKELASKFSKHITTWLAYDYKTKAEDSEYVAIETNVSAEGEELVIDLSTSNFNLDFFGGQCTALIQVTVSEDEKADKSKAEIESDVVEIVAVDKLAPINPVDPDVPMEVVDLDLSGNANCYIVSKKGRYRFSTLKGNSDELVENIASVGPLWESFGTSQAPNVGDLVYNVRYSEGKVTFDVSDKKGNAVVAAKDANGTILWSWHIWLTDQPANQLYYNGTLVQDRNLGATSATPGEDGIMGLLYQWGRKDPFLGIYYTEDKYLSREQAASTYTWPDVVLSDENVGTIEYAQAHPTTFIVAEMDDGYNKKNADWCYNPGVRVSDNTRWQSTKTIYDPCPPGYRVPDGGHQVGLWAESWAETEYILNYSDYCFNLSKVVGDDENIFYPVCGGIDGYILEPFDGKFNIYNDAGAYWSVTVYKDGYSYNKPSDPETNILHTHIWCIEFSKNTLRYQLACSGKSTGHAVRCCKE